MEIELDAQLEALLIEAARQQGKTPDKLANDYLREYFMNLKPAINLQANESAGE